MRKVTHAGKQFARNFGRVHKKTNNLPRMASIPVAIQYYDDLHDITEGMDIRDIDADIERLEKAPGTHANIEMLSYARIHRKRGRYLVLPANHGCIVDNDGRAIILVPLENACPGGQQCGSCGSCCPQGATRCGNCGKPL